MSPKSEHQFVVGEMDTSQAVKEVVAAAKIDPYLVEYLDHEGKKKVSMAFVPHGSKSVFLLQQRISGVHVATTASEWFSKAFVRFLEEHNISAPTSVGAVDQV